MRTLSVDSRQILVFVRTVVLAVLAATVSPPVAHAQSAFLMPRAQFERFQNRADAQGSGSCVQASLAMCGAHHAVAAAESLLVDSPHGPAVLGGSWPERVERYCRQRGIAAFNVEGGATIDWIDWALTTGRYAAITYGTAHMITAVGFGGAGTYLIVDNNYPGEVRRVRRETFLREHRRYGGGWCVILDTPGPPPWTLPQHSGAMR
jgi:hypothetical protein